MLRLSGALTILTLVAGGSVAGGSVVANASAEPVVVAAGANAASATASPILVRPPLADLSVPTPARDRVRPEAWMAQAEAPDRSLAGVVRYADGTVDAWADRDQIGGEPTWTLPVQNEFGNSLVVWVLETDGPYLRVQVPVRPNRSTGWVLAEDFELSVVDTAVVVDLSDRELSFFADGELQFSSTVTVGRPAHPTPTGTFYLRDSFAWDPNSVYGPYVMPLSAFSESIETINGGEAVVAIHGTKRPAELGQAKSLGCIRLPNDRITEMAQYIDLGTVVTIQE